MLAERAVAAAVHPDDRLFNFAVCRPAATSHHRRLLFVYLGGRLLGFAEFACMLACLLLVCGACCLRVRFLSLSRRGKPVPVA